MRVNGRLDTLRRHRADEPVGTLRATPRLRTHSYHTSMSKLLRGLAAGYGAKKMGGGCFSTVLIFILLWWLLGHFRVFQ
jgi:hypothetical protein